MKTVNDVLEAIDSFNNTFIEEVTPTKHFTHILFTASNFAVRGLKDIGVEASHIRGTNEWFVLTPLPNTI